MGDLLRELAALAALVAAPVAGRTLGGWDGPRWVRRLPAILAGAAVFLFLFHRLYPEWDPPLLRIVWWARGEYLAVGIPVLVAAGDAARRRESPAARVRILTLAGFLGAMLAAPFFHPLLLRSSWRAATPRVRDGVVLQTHGWSCGAAALATALGCHGVAVTEADVALRCHTGILGTDVDEILAAIPDLAPGRAGECRNLGVDGAAELRSGDLLMAKLGAITGHWMVFLDREGDHFVLGDPLAGRVRVSAAEFASLWAGRAVVIRKRE